MRERAAGRSSITALRAVYYIVKVLLALFVELFRPRTSRHLEDCMTPAVVIDRRLARLARACWASSSS